MRKGEKALVMIKPKWGFRHPDFLNRVTIPIGWEEEDKLKILRKRRVFYEVKLYDWIVRHDLDGDKMIIKTIERRGIGYDRPFDYDEITIDLKVYQLSDDQQPIIYQNDVDLSTLMHEGIHISNTVKKILQSMKPEEKVRCVVQPEYFTEKDPHYNEKHQVKSDRNLIIDVEMKKLVRVDDLYKDKTTFFKTLAKGEGTASPYTDALVLCKKVKA